MFEETNQTDATPNTGDTATIDTTSSDDSFFDPADFADDGVNQPTTETQAKESEDQTETQATQEVQEVQSSQAAGEKYKVKYNGKEMELTLDELLANAQKGLNYDHVLTERDSLKNSPEFKLLDEEAAKYGLTRAEYIQHAKTNKLVQETLAKYPGMPEEAALEIAQLKLQEDRVKNVDESLRQQTQLAEQKNKLMASFDRIMRENKLDVMPNEVIELVASGRTPEDAWISYENKQLKTKLAALEQNDKNRKTAIPSVKDNQKEDYDPFLAGFLGK